MKAATCNIDPDGHQTTTADKIKQGAADFITGVGRGISSSLTFGASGAPRADDSLINRAGQGVGTVATAVAGYAVFNAGGGATILSGGSAAELSVPVAVTGVVTVAGATVNAISIASTPMQQNSSEEYSNDDIERMKKGRAPTGSDGNPKELHHPNQNPRAPVREMTRSELYEPEGDGVIKHLQIYDAAKDLNMSEQDVKVVWSSDEKKCGVSRQLFARARETKKHDGRLYL